MSLVSFTLFIAPTLIIGGCYMVIVATIWSQGSALRQGPTRDTRRASSRGLIPRAKIKTVKMTFVIVFGESFQLFPLSPSTPSTSNERLDFLLPLPLRKTLALSTKIED